MTSAQPNNLPNNLDTAGEQALERVLMRSQRLFLFLLAFFVLGSCFVYGLTVGTKTSLAVSAKSSANKSNPWRTLTEPEVAIDILNLAPSMIVNPMGNDMLVNGRDSGMWSIGSEQPAKELLVEQERRWKSLGYVTEGMVTAKRGVLIAHGGPRGDRLMLTVWKVLPAVRQQVGTRIQGLLARMGEPTATAIEDTELPAGLVPRPGGKGGAVVASTDEVDEQGVGVRTVSVTFSNPGPVADNLQYYQGALDAEGWEALTAGVPTNGPSLYLRRGMQEALLIFTPINQSSMLASGAGTQVFVTVFNSRAVGED